MVGPVKGECKPGDLVYWSTSRGSPLAKLLPRPFLSERVFTVDYTDAAGDFYVRRLVPYTPYATSRNPHNMSKKAKESITKVADKELRKW